MTIKRQYILPNCTLILEGLSNDPINNLSLDILVNAECHLVTCNQVLSGGRLFFESLVKAVSAYAQEFLSGLRHPRESQKDVDLILLTKNEDTEKHHLIWQKVADESNPDSQKVEVDLTTVELFDLIETIDQFLADSLTLPDLSVAIQPVHKRYRTVEEPLVQRATPPVLGVASLALAGFAIFFLPIPEAKKSEPEPQATPTPTLPSTPSSNE